MDKSLTAEKKAQLLKNFDASISYSSQVGNIYTGSLYLGFLSLLENSTDLNAGDKIGFFSYGSGAVSEIFSGQLVEGYQDQLKDKRQQDLDQRQPLSVADYEKLFYEEPQLDSAGNCQFQEYLTGPFALTAIKEHQRQYQRVINHDKT